MQNRPKNSRVIERSVTDTPIFVGRKGGKSCGAVPKSRRGHLDRHVKMWIFADKINYKYQVSRETMKSRASFHVKPKMPRKTAKIPLNSGFFWQVRFDFFAKFQAKNNFKSFLPKIFTEKICVFLPKF